MPIFTLRKIEAYFLKSGKTRKTVKRTEELLNDIFHDNIMCKKDEEFFYVKAICGASYRKQNHQLSLGIDKHKGTVCYYYCTCRAGKGGFCNHMYGLIKTMASFSLEKQKTVPILLPCTSKSHFQKEGT